MDDTEFRFSSWEDGEEPTDLTGEEQCIMSNSTLWTLENCTDHQQFVCQYNPLGKFFLEIFSSNIMLYLEQVNGLAQIPHGKILK